MDIDSMFAIVCVKHIAGCSLFGALLLDARKANLIILYSNDLHSPMFKCLLKKNCL